MRVGLLVAIALAGCYRPAPEGHCTVACGANGECPGELRCNGQQFCTVGAAACDTNDAGMDEVLDDSSADAPHSLVCKVFGGVPQAIVPGADSYTRVGTREVYFAIGEQQIYVLDPAEQPRPVGQFLFPRLAANGKEIFAVNAGASQMYRAVLDTQWSFVEIEAMPRGLRPGTVTSTDPRRMISHVQGQLYEGVENGAAWDFQLIGSFGRSVVADPSIDSTGLRMVFVSSVPGGGVVIEIATRDTLGSPWNEPVELFDASGVAEATPFLSESCGELYYAADGATYMIQ